MPRKTVYTGLLQRAGKRLLLFWSGVVVVRNIPVRSRKRPRTRAMSCISYFRLSSTRLHEYGDAPPRERVDVCFSSNWTGTTRPRLFHSRSKKIEFARASRTLISTALPSLTRNQQMAALGLISGRERVLRRLRRRIHLSRRLVRRQLLVQHRRRLRRRGFVRIPSSRAMLKHVWDSGATTYLRIWIYATSTTATRRRRWSMTARKPSCPLPITPLIPTKAADFHRLANQRKP